MNADMREECLRVLNSLMSDKYYENCMFFYGPVKDVLDEAEWKVYKSIIKNPRDLGTIRSNLEANKYSNTAAFSKDVELCFENAKKYSATRYPAVATSAVTMLKVFRNELDLMIQRLNKSKPITTSASAPPAAHASISYEAACIDIIDTLKKLNYARWFITPIDFTILSDYESRIPHPIDLSTIRSNLEQHHYSSIEAFARDTRRVFGNCMRYHYGIIEKSALGKDRRQYRTDAKLTLQRFEQEFAKKFPNASHPMQGTRECLLAIDEIFKTSSVNPLTTPLSCGMSFTHPVSYYYGGQFPEGYLDVVSAPMDLGTVISKLAECDYKSVDDVKRDIYTICANVEAYWKFQFGEDGMEKDDLVRDARRLVEKFDHTLQLELARVTRKDEEMAARSTEAADQTKIKSERAQSLSSQKPALGLKSISKLDLREKLTWVVSSLKQHFTDSPYGVVYTATLFLKAVDTRLYPDYPSIVSNPMDLAQIEKKIKGERYTTLASFLADIELIRNNCHAYNAGDLNAETRKLADLFLHQAEYLLSVIASEIQVHFDATTIAAVLDEATLASVMKQYSQEIISFYEPYVKMRIKKPSKVPAIRPPASAPVEVVTPSTSRSSKGKRDSIKVENNAPEVPIVTISTLKPLSKLDLRDRLSWIVACLKQHYVNGPYGAVYTAYIFSKAVDPLKFPDYPMIVSNPMDLAQVEKKIKGERYTTLASFLADIELIRNNCHAYNTGDENIEPRILADMLLEQAKYLSSVIAKEIQEQFDASSSAAVLDDVTLAAINKEYKSDLVAFFAPYVKMRNKKPSKASKTARDSFENGDLDAMMHNDELGDLHSLASDSTRTSKARRSQGGRKQAASVEAMEVVEPQLTRISSTYMAPTEWEEACIEVYRRVTKHEFVDLARARPGSITANFFVPVTEQHPSVAESYLSIVAHPMDFTIINERLLSHGFLDGEDFYNNMILVFQNAVDYNLPHKDSDYACKLVPRCQHMISYINWLSQEYLPTVDDTDASQPEALGAIRTSLRDKYRSDRIELLSQRSVEHTRDCLALLKKFENRKYSREYFYFARPINMIDAPNYSTWVKRPMDFSTIKDKLEKDKYSDYMAFINDIRLIFSNAKKFNGNFMETDAMSKKIYEAAELFETLLDSVLHKEFTLDVAERISWLDIRRAEEAVVEAERQVRLDKEREDDMKFRQAEIERLKSIDRAFASEQLKSIPDAVSPAHPSGNETPSSDKKKGMGVDRLIQHERDEMSRKVVRDTAWGMWPGYGRSRPEAEVMEVEGVEETKDASEEPKGSTVVLGKNATETVNEAEENVTEETKREPAVFIAVNIVPQSDSTTSKRRLNISLKRRVLPPPIFNCVDEADVEEPTCRTPRRGKRKAAASESQAKKRRREDTTSPSVASVVLCDTLVPVEKSQDLSWRDNDTDSDVTDTEPSLQPNKHEIEKVTIRRILLPELDAQHSGNGVLEGTSESNGVDSRASLTPVDDITSQAGAGGVLTTEALDSTAVAQGDASVQSMEIVPVTEATPVVQPPPSFVSVVEYPSLIPDFRVLEVFVPAAYYEKDSDHTTTRGKHPEEYPTLSDISSLAVKSDCILIAYSNIKLTITKSNKEICTELLGEANNNKWIVKHGKHRLCLNRRENSSQLQLCAHYRQPDRVFSVHSAVCSETLRECVCTDGRYVLFWVLVDRNTETSIDINTQSAHTKISL